MDDANLMATVAYVFGLLSGLVIYILNRDKYVRFHAIQSMLFCMVVASVWSLVGIIMVWTLVTPRAPLVSGIVFLILSLGIGGVWFLATLFLMYNAHRGKKSRLPVLGRIAERFA